jgi:hypothetical protein
MSLQKYTGTPYIFCRHPNVYSVVRMCAQPALVKDSIPPKKARVYNKPSNTMTMSQVLSWASRNRYR